MDKEIRNLINRATQDARRLLENEYQEQLEGTFDIMLNGSIAAKPGNHLDDMQCLIREKLIASVEHKQAGGIKPDEAVAAYLREASFTTLNRVVALKMLEARGLSQECISKADQSSGFKEFCGLAPGISSLPDKGYQMYIECLFDEIGREVRVLFDRQDASSLLWPQRKTLTDLIDILNRDELAEVWKEDETIGWVYQYFNGDDERKKMRAESQAPRNSRELAVRNQFFTPRYVVEFLSDNTLGRTWYEMRQGNTRLVDECDYLVRRPSEVFLKKREEPPKEDETADENISQEELLKKTVYIPFRAKKDPRDLKILDPACGSGHFLLYCFDLLLTIYEEAWNDPDSPNSEASGQTLQMDFPDFNDLKAKMPGLILQYNLHGVDIDPRAAQIASLALWMRAQRACNDFSISRAERLPIKKTNIVVAEPMPGKKEMLKEFAETLRPKLLGQMVEVIFKEMQLAGEAGSLLKIEETIQDVIKHAKKEWEEWKKRKPVQTLLFGESEKRKPKQLTMFDMSGLTDKQYWVEAEDNIYGALKKYSEQIGGENVFKRKLFAKDAVRGFAFIDLMRNKYDVILMNPPFGSVRKEIEDNLKTIDDKLPKDLYCWFAKHLLMKISSQGLIGLITNATFIKYVDFAVFRDFLLNHLNCALIDLGWDVLDANVLTALYIIGKPDNSCHFCDLKYDNIDKTKEDKLKEFVQSIINSKTNNYSFLRPLTYFSNIEGKPFIYSISPNVLKNINQWKKLKDLCEEIGKGAGPHAIFYRYYFEVPIDEVGMGKRWWKYANGGGYSPFCREYPLLLEWRNAGRLVKSYILEKYPYLKGNTDWNIQLETYYGRLGLNYGKKTETFSCQIMTEGHIFSFEGIGIFPENKNDLWWILGYLNSSFVSSFLNLICGLHKNPVYLRKLPVPNFSDDEKKYIETMTKKCVQIIENSIALDDTCALFNSDKFVESLSSSITIKEWLQTHSGITQNYNKIIMESLNGIDHIVKEHVEAKELCLMNRPSLKIYSPDLDSLYSFFMGSIFKRWDKNSSKEIFVDDPGHPKDILIEIKNYIKSIFFDKYIDIFQEIDQLNKEKDLRFLLRKYFFQTHIKKFTKARRKAPIYWQVSTATASYSVWLYYHSCTKDTFYKVQNDYVIPKLQHEERNFTNLQQEYGAKATAKQRKEIADQETFVEELQRFKQEVARIAPLWNPNLNDGVIINFAPLWRLVPQLKTWQKECKKVWDKLVKGEYDWAHLSMHLWPERVVPKCQKDRSLAIAHDLEEILWYEADDGKCYAKDVAKSEIDKLIQERTSASVKAALEDLLSAPAPSSTSRKRKKK